jgi:hypothetical protein
MQRRTLLRLGLGSAALIALVGGGVALMQPALRNGQLTASGQAVFKGIARAVLDGSLPTAPAANAAALTAHLTRMDAAIAAFPAATQAELSQLLSLLASAPGRIGLMGLSADWDVATVPQIQAALHGLRTSSLALRQQTYHALRDLTNAAFYADAEAWKLMGYPGPVTI